MSEACFAVPDNHSTLSHEVGHYFNLLHTHTGSGEQDGDGIIGAAYTNLCNGIASHNNIINNYNYGPS